MVSEKTVWNSKAEHLILDYWVLRIYRLSIVYIYVCGGTYEGSGQKKEPSRLVRYVSLPTALLTEAS